MSRKKGIEKLKRLSLKGKDIILMRWRGRIEVRIKRKNDELRMSEEVKIIDEIEIWKRLKKESDGSKEKKSYISIKKESVKNIKW